MYRKQVKMNEYNGLYYTHTYIYDDGIWQLSINHLSMFVFRCFVPIPTHQTLNDAKHQKMRGIK